MLRVQNLQQKWTNLQPTALNTGTDRRTLITVIMAINYLSRQGLMSHLSNPKSFLRCVSKQLIALVCTKKQNNQEKLIKTHKTYKKQKKQVAQLTQTDCDLQYSLFYD